MRMMEAAAQEWPGMNMVERNAYLCGLHGVVNAQIAYMLAVGVPEAEIRIIFEHAVSDATALVRAMRGAK